MTIRISLTVLLAGVVAAPMIAQTPAENHLEKLAWTIGGKWVAEIKTPKGDPFTVEATFAWTGHKKALKYAVVFKTKEEAVPQYEGIYWWNPANKEIRLLQVDRAGNVTEAILTVDGDTFAQRNTLTRVDGTKQEQRAQFIRENDNLFSFKAFVPKGNEWVEAVGFKYKRVPDGAQPRAK